MNTKKMNLILRITLGLLVLLGLISVYLGSKALTSSAQKLNNLKLETSVVDEQQNSLSRARQDIEKYAELEIIAKTIVPQEKDQARTVREIVKIAEDSDVPLTSITFPASKLGETTPSSNNSSNSTGEGSTPAASTTPPALSQLEKVKGLGGVYQMEMILANEENRPVTYDNFVAFLRRLEQNRRTSQITSVGIQPQANNRNLLKFSLTLQVYIRP